MSELASVLLLCHNKLEYTRQSVAALRRNTAPELYELVVIDNASTDETPQFLNQIADEMPSVKIVRNSENLGFIGGNNRGAEVASGQYLFFLNNDTQVQPGWLEPLTNLMAQDSTVGAIGSKLVYPDGRLQEAGGMIFCDGSGWNYGKFDDPNDPEYNYIREVDYCSGAALMVRADLFRAMGGFDVLFDPAYWEDTDLCFAVRRAGYRVLYHPASVVVHYEGVTNTTNVQTGRKRYQEINRPKFMRKWAREMAELPPNPPDIKSGRRVCDRRCRNGKQILVAVDNLPQHDQSSGRTMFCYIRLLLEAGHHVTLAARITAQPGQAQDSQRIIRELREAGVLVYPLDQIKIEGELVSPEAALQQLLQRREYAVALLWATPDVYGCARQIRMHSPATQVYMGGDPGANLPIFVQEEGRASMDAENASALRGAFMDSSWSEFIGRAIETRGQSAPGLTFGAGFYHDEGNWRWMGQIGNLFIWSQALSTPKVLSFELECGQAENYTPFPLQVRVYVGQELSAQVKFESCQQKHVVQIPLQTVNDDVHVRLESDSAYIPAQLGINTDKRVLSVRLHNLRLL
jgi:GT2 family glycosyltransferase